LAPDEPGLLRKVLLTEPIEAIVDATGDPAHLGGTHHLSAAQFAHELRDTIALVASQDGQFTGFAWSSITTSFMLIASNRC
jgi:hypothetical protein